MGKFKIEEVLRWLKIIAEVIEIILKGTDKGTAANLVAKRHGVSAAEILRRLNKDKRFN